MPPDVPVQGSSGPGKSWMEHFPRTVSKLGRHVATSACQGPATDIPRLRSLPDKGKWPQKKRPACASSGSTRSQGSDLGWVQGLPGPQFPLCKMRLRPFSPSGSTQSLWGRQGGMDSTLPLSWIQQSLCLSAGKQEGQEGAAEGKGRKLPWSGEACPNPALTGLASGEPPGTRNEKAKQKSLRPRFESHLSHFLAV